MDDKTTRVISNSQVQTEATDVPLYAVLKDGEYTLLDIQDMPCLTFTDNGLTETKFGARDQTAKQLVKYLGKHTFEAGFLITLIEEASDAAKDPAKTRDDYLSACVQVFMQLDHCLTRSKA